jgi:hypothetical protein
VSQTVYNEKPTVAMPGMIADNTDNCRIRTAKMVEAGGAPFGIFVTKGANAGEVEYVDAAGDKISGLLVHTHHIDRTNLPAGMDINVNDIVPVAEQGRFYVLIEEDMVEDDPVYVRHTANGAGKLQLGAIGKDGDDPGGGATRVLLKGATVRVGGLLAAGAVAVVAFNLEASRV